MTVQSKLMAVGMVLALWMAGTVAVIAMPSPVASAAAKTQEGTMAASPNVEPKTIKIVAKRFAFSPNQITLKKGEPVRLELTSEDVAHGFFLRPLKIDEVVSPGKPVVIDVTPQTAGKFTPICDRFCGAGHGNMNMSIVVEE